MTVPATTSALRSIPAVSAENHPPYPACCSASVGPANRASSAPVNGSSAATVRGTGKASVQGSPSVSLTR